METDTQKTFHQKKQEITLIALYYFSFVISARIRVVLAHSPHFKLALSTAPPGTQLPGCLSAFLNKYTAIRPIQRPLTQSCLHVLHSNKQHWGQQEGYDHLMSSQKFLSGKLFTSRTPWQHQPVAWQNTLEYIGGSSIFNTSQNFAHCLEAP